MRNKKPVSTTGSNTYLNKKQIAMTKDTVNHENPQAGFNCGRPPKIFKVIICFTCKKNAELDGYVFKLVPVCADCRTESEVVITRNRFERRHQR